MYGSEVLASCLPPPEGGFPPGCAISPQNFISARSLYHKGPGEDPMCVPGGEGMWETSGLSIAPKGLSPPTAGTFPKSSPGDPGVVLASVSGRLLAWGPPPCQDRGMR